MALSKVDYNSLNVTPAASKALKWNSTPNGFETGDIGGDLVLLETQTASSDSTITFDSSIDSTYKEYIFKFIDVHPSANAYFSMNGRDGGSSYDAIKTTTFFNAQHFEDDTSTVLEYDASRDLAQGTGIQHISTYAGTGNDESINGEMHLFDPSSTTFVKHFIIRTCGVTNNPAAFDSYISGYFNVTAAIDGVQFSMSSGNIDAGTFKMYGVT
jgi:hypothetical protein